MLHQWGAWFLLKIDMAKKSANIC